MCYNKQASLTAFIVGILSSLSLVAFGDKKYEQQNKIIATLFFFVAFMQLFDYMMYIDPNCQSGWNKLAGYLAPLFNAFQPIILYIFILQLNPSQSSKVLTSFINISYILYVFYIYFNYLNTNRLCSYSNNGRLTWSWYENGFGLTWKMIYLVVAVYNICMLFEYKYFIASMIIAFFFLFISIFNFRYHIGEFWCWFVNSVPLIILIMQKLNIAL